MRPSLLLLRLASALEDPAIVGGNVRKPLKPLEYAGLPYRKYAPQAVTELAEAIQAVHCTPRRLPCRRQLFNFRHCERRPLSHRFEDALGGFWIVDAAGYPYRVSGE